MSRSRTISSRLTAPLVALAMLASAGPAATGAAPRPDGPNSLSGRIFFSDGRTPVKGAVVKAFHHGTEEIIASPQSGPDGAYRLEGLGAGEYDLGVSTTEGIYLVEESLKFGGGRNRVASFALQPAAAGPEEPAGQQGQASTSEGEKTDEPQAEPESKPKEKKPVKLKRPRAAGGRVKTPLVATGIVIGSALVVGAVANNLTNDDDGSPN